MASKEVATVPEGGLYLAQYDGNMGELGVTVSENLGTGGIGARELPRIRIPSGGGQAWEVPSLEGIEAEKTITGVIVHWRTMRAYFDRPFEDGAGEPPVCYSEDGEQGIGDPGVACGTCAFNVFGSADGGRKRGKACREVRALFFLTESDTLPYFLPLPVMSIKPMKDYFTRLTMKAVPYFGVETTLALEKDKNAEGIAYSKALPQFSRILEPNERARIAEYRQFLMPVLNGVRVEREDVYDN